MEVIYYMRNYYPLTAAQKMHHNWIVDYGTQQVSGVSVVASVQAELDFGLLKKCIQMEMERSDCTRVRFTKPDKDGNVKQYIEKQDPRDIELKDLSGMESLAKADELMQHGKFAHRDIISVKCFISPLLHQLICLCQTFHSRQILQLNISRILLLYILFYISIFIRLCKTDSGTA